MPTPNSAAADDLYKAARARNKAPNDQLTQDLLAPEEHKQAVEEVTADNPIKGTAMAAMAAPYAAAKALGIKVGDTGDAKTSRASMDEVFAAGEGYVAGLKRYVKGK